MAKRTGEKTDDRLGVRLLAFATERFPTEAGGLAEALEPILAACRGGDEAAIDALREPARAAILERFGSATPPETLETSRPFARTNGWPSKFDASPTRSTDSCVVRRFVPRSAKTRKGICCGGCV